MTFVYRIRRLFFVISAAVVFACCGRIGFESRELDDDSWSATESVEQSDTTPFHDTESNTDELQDTSDESGTDAAADECPDDNEKLQAGICGCGFPDTDRDGDGTPDCVDNCPDDAQKTEPGVCGCGNSDINGNGICEQWTLLNWGYRKALLLDTTALQGSHDDFPVLIHIQNDSSLSSYTRSDGHDIRFVSEEGDILEHQTETYLSEKGSLLAWVKLPRIDAGGDALIFLYYGNDSATSDPSITTVWSNRYLAVWHLGESGIADEFFDSSGNRHNARGGAGDPNLSPSRAAGKIGDGQDGDGIDDFIATPIQLSGQSEFTLTGWFLVRQTQNLPRPGLFGQNNALEIGFYWPDRLNVWTPSIETICPEKGIVSACTGEFGLNVWTHIAIVFNGVNATLYINGEAKHVVIAPNIGSSGAMFNLMGRVFDNTGNHLDGIIDEVRLANTARSASWIAAQYAIQSEPARFYTLGPEQTIRR